MAKRQREIFLTTFLSDLLSQRPQWQIHDHSRIEWSGQPRNLWPEADIVIETDERRFIIEYDEDSDPGRSLIKYWPILHLADKPPISIIEIWKRGPTIGLGYAELAKWMAARLMELYPWFVYEFIERREESSRCITKKLIGIVEACSTKAAE